MIQALHHVTLAVEGLAPAMATLEGLFGRPAERLDAQRAWLPLANTALLLVARDAVDATVPLAPCPAGTPAVLAGLGFAVADLAAAAILAERRGVPGQTLPPDNPAVVGAGPMVALAPGAANGLHIGLLQAAAGGVGPIATSEGLGLDHVVIRSHNPDRSIALLAGRLGLDLRLDRSREGWRNRLIFFRCGDLVVEVSHDPAAGISDAPDALSGVCWRSADVAATHARLAAAGFPVSPLRQGRKAGTRIFVIEGDAGLVRSAVIGR